MPTDIQIGPHFRFLELTTSRQRPDLEDENRAEATRHLAQLYALTWGVLEPIRRRWGATFVSSGYRSSALNKAVGGQPNSDHLRGVAADIWRVQQGSLEEMFHWVRKGDLPFGQVILEDTRQQGWNAVHVSLGWPLNDRGRDGESWVYADGVYTLADSVFDA